MANTDSDSSTTALDFETVSVRARHDGWTPDKQTAFIETLAECGCVADACRRVGMSSESVYALRRRIDAVSFRDAWDKALDYAVSRLSDAVCSRAIHGVAVPHFYKGEQIGEHRRYDERLAMFLLRYRDPLRYAKTNDAFIYKGIQGGYAYRLSRAVDQLADDAWDEALRAPGEPPGWPHRRAKDEDEDDDSLD